MLTKKHHAGPPTSVGRTYGSITVTSVDRGQWSGLCTCGAAVVLARQRVHKLARENGGKGACTSCRPNRRPSHRHASILGSAEVIERFLSWGLEELARAALVNDLALVAMVRKVCGA